ncbi:hypothetical protein [Streptomyces sp. NPDC059783]|uniref:hypothetical protein n=1 Tax=Streptomyces sp. NPDC059783 TaxID=3346944 RepID=UPI0036666973
MDDHLIFRTDVEFQPPRAVGRSEPVASPQGSSLSGLLDTLERLEGEFDQRLTAIVETDAAVSGGGGGGGPTALSAFDLLRPFTEAMQSMGRAEEGGAMPALPGHARPSFCEKRFLIDGVDVALGAFQDPVVLMAYLAPQRPFRQE